NSDHDQGHHHLNEAEASRRFECHVSIPCQHVVGLVAPPISDLMAPTAEMAIQRFQLALAGLLLSISVAQEAAAPTLAKPSRLKVTNCSVPALPSRLSVSGICERKIAPLVAVVKVRLLFMSTKTIQPLL